MARARWTAADLTDLSGRTVVVTGGSGGLGKIIATELARVGASVTLAVRDVAKGRAAAETMAGRTDVRASTSADHGLRVSMRKSGEIDIVVANAGLEIIDQAISDAAEGQFERLLAGNS